MKKRNRLIAIASALCLVCSIEFGNAIMPQEAYADTVTQITNDRLYGADRYETSVKISKAGWQQSDFVVLVDGENFPDALCAAPLAKLVGAPILLTEHDRLNKNAKEEIKRLNPKTVYIIGKYGAVSESTESEISALNITVKRLGGKDRYETSALVAGEVKKLKEVDNTPISEIALASGSGYADALSIASIAASKGMPILLTSRDALPDCINSFIQSNKGTIKDSYIIGGTPCIGQNILSTVPQPLRLSGEDRYETNENVMNWFKDELKFENVYVAIGGGPNGNEYADALCGSALACKTSSPIILTNKSLASNTENLMKLVLNSSSKVIALGGNAVVPDSIIASLKDIAASGTSTSDSTTSSTGTSGSTTSGTVASGSTTSGTGTSIGSGMSISVNDELKAISSKLDSVIKTVSDDEERNLLTAVKASIDSLIADPGYNYKAAASNILTMLGKLNADKVSDLKSVLKSSFDESEIRNLMSYFGV